MAEFLFKKMVADKGTAARFEIASAATSREEIGNGVYPPAKALLKRLGIDTTGKTARQITKQDLDYYAWTTTTCAICPSCLVITKKKKCTSA